LRKVTNKQEMLGVGSRVIKKAGKTSGDIPFSLTVMKELAMVTKNSV